MTGPKTMGYPKVPTVVNLSRQNTTVSSRGLGRSVRHDLLHLHSHLKGETPARIRQRSLLILGWAEVCGLSPKSLPRAITCPTKHFYIRRGRTRVGYPYLKYDDILPFAPTCLVKTKQLKARMRRRLCNRKEACMMCANPNRVDVFLEVVKMIRFES
ncbi:hypothetical protein LCGC14_1892910 [marine sediment metagenome]|uniref:Uncharacterized protein n=1 Tax=marine sediment metagenome TaxID=412755 RepID=A0A0F9GM78_9ZZZZ